MKRIIIHWTAGGYFPAAEEKMRYHFLVDKAGKVHKGNFRPEDNEICKSGRYAAHTGGGNTGSVGVAVCAMAGFKNRNHVGHYPVVLEQFEAAMKLCAELCVKYKIDVMSDTVMTHYEFGLKNPKTSSAGKIDIIFIPPYSWISQQEAGGFIRSKIKWYIQKLRGEN
ncbi:MAG: N-acetylmuramoyl-L-alanine amidase [Heliobacteriaceae bacterium]|jgi:N-acetyl-anhydromuramyl-L-alanine amidase AmpD|nr:N-acetylmuramoyl-L-alanine amidase [Heliobacteriaceae bacterium]